jgi:hypothetical protein
MKHCNRQQFLLDNAPGQFFVFCQYSQLHTPVNRMNPSRLAQISNKLLDNRLTGPLFDTPRFMDNLGTAYTAIHDQYQAGSPPGNIRF